jgi:hypothetical protein
MMAFNMNDYEDVATLNKWFIGNYPMGRSDILVVSHDPVNGYILVQATLWRDAKDSTPAVSNIAFGSRETYIPNMKKFYVEDTATSALGRAIILLKGSDKTATRDDMRKVENEPLKNNYGKNGNAQLIELALRKSFRDDAKSEGEPKAWSVGDAIETIPTKPQQQECSHGMMILKEGIAKTGRPFMGYVCSASKPEQCEARWGKLTANGNWYFEGGE